MTWLLNILRTILGSPTPVAPPAPPPPVANPGGFIEQLLTLHNQARAAKGLPPLSLNPLLQRAAITHADWMSYSKILSHTEGTKTFEQRVQATGYAMAMAGENIADGQQTASAVMAAWLGSPPHRQNILTRGYVDVGIDYALSSTGQLYWCVVFGCPAARPNVGDGPRGPAGPVLFCSGPISKDA